MHWSEKYPGRTTYKIGVDSKEQQCNTCRKWIKNEPYAIRDIKIPYKWRMYEVRCWRCWHGEKITKRFMDEFPGMFKREKKRGWYYLSLAQDWLIFPSSLSENVSA